MLLSPAVLTLALPTMAVPCHLGMKDATLCPIWRGRQRLPVLSSKGVSSSAHPACTLTDRNQE